MKIMLKISMICGLLLSFFQPMQAKRQDSPPVAILKAMNGDFNVSEKDQLLADLPTEWKAQHKSLVNQIKRGEIGRDPKKIKIKDLGKKKEDFKIEGLGDDEGKKDVPLSDFEIKEFIPSTEDLEESDKNALRLVKEIGQNLDQFVEKKYKVSGLDPWGIKSEYKGEDLKINSNSYNGNYKKIIEKFNGFITWVNSFELEQKKSMVKNMLTSGENLLENLAVLASKNDSVKNGCLVIALILDNWNARRLSGALEYNTKDFAEKLEKYITEFGGTKK